MERILSRQNEITKELESINTNFKKDSPSRKTAEYISKRKEQLETLFKELEDNDKKLHQFPNPTGEYFEKRYFDQIRDYYISTLLMITSYKTTEDKGDNLNGSNNFNSPTRQDRAGDSRTEELMKKQSSNFRAFTRTVENIHIESVTEKWEFEDLLRNLQSRWSVIDSLHWEIDSELDGSNSVYENAFCTHERKYNEIKKSINSKLWSVSHREKYTPQMEIPEFSGNYHHWESFKDLFGEAIHRNLSLSDAQKMQFLKSKVKGEAERLIQHLPITSDNYKTSWEILNHRFNNKKLIFNSHINTMMNITVMQQPSVNHIKRIHDTTLESLNAIKNLGVNISTWDPLLVHILSQKLDTQTYNDYMESLKQPRELPSLKELLDFLESKFTIMEASRRKHDAGLPLKASSSNQMSAGIQYPKPNNFKQSFFNNQNVSQPSTSNSYNNKNCPLCNDEHGIYYCKRFLVMPALAKRKTVAKLNLCYNCLYNHFGKPCISTKKCRDCNGSHNTILHEAFKVTNSTPRVGAATTKNDTANDTSDSDANSHVSQVNNVPEILLATAMINIQAFDGTYHEMRALIDQGSQLSLITENAAQRLSIPRQKCRGVISGVGIKESSSKGQIQINCLSRDKTYRFSTDVLIMKSLVRNLPNQSITKPSLEYLSNIQLADPDFNISRPVDLLLGAEVYSNIILEGICRATTASPVAQQTKLGWILCGNVSTNYQCNVVLNSLDEIEQFWKIEDISEESDLTSEDHQCIQYYQETTTRMEDGRYEVRLPLKSNYQDLLGASKKKAVAQFLQIEQKLNKNQYLSKEYRLFVKEYQELRHMIPATSNAKPDCYLPHHGVIRHDKPTTPIRVVFNASAQTSSGKSLNDLMARGPNLQQDLQTLILKWRQYQVAFTADIEKMFRQIWVHENDQALQKIIWRDSTSEQIREYQLTTVTYGTKAAPFLAMLTLKQLAKDESNNYQGSQAPKILDESFYMDDLLHGSHSLAEAKQLQHDLINLLKAGGFNLRKWSSNYPELQDDSMKSNEQENKFEFRQAESTKTLGLHWHPEQDEFSFQSRILPVQTATKITKRKLLSDVSKIFDPLGWLTPLTTKLKLLFQQVWGANLQWDDAIPKDILAEWDKVRADISNINTIKVPRWLHTEKTSSIELHGFCDSSNSAFACVIYCKINYKDKPILVIAKARVVSPKKNVTLPRLELCAAELLSRLIFKVRQCFTEYDVKVFGWTDSTAVLGWLQGDSNRWKPFVANRVNKINNIIDPNCWHYVKSSDNPADCGSRGITATQLQQHPLWWNGPKWLETYNSESITNDIKYQTNEEAKKTKQVNICTRNLDTSSNIVLHLLSRYSSFKKVVRVIAWIRRFLSKKQHQPKSSFLTVQELRAARTNIIKQVQEIEFPSEINQLKSNKQIDSKSKILNLHPYLDGDGLLRVGGRLANANISEDMKHPIIIPHSSILTDLLIDAAHSNVFHGGARLTLSNLRAKYWIIGGNRAVKKRLLPCIICCKNKPSKNHQLMGDLPAARVNPSRPFYHTAVDFTGHVDVKTNKGRGAKTTKGYVAVFVCMVTKAVHLELVSDMTSISFLSALRRLAARRGAPRHIFSDNGTNFVGGCRTLNQEYINLKEVTDPAFFKEIADMEIKWHFQAPSWPSAGGLHEGAVKSLKYHLRRVLGEQKLTYEEFATLLSRLEACLNTRPLCAISEDPEDLDYLTPSHFLASGPTLTIVDTETDERTRWQHAQKIFKDVWKRWHTEYLAQLSARSKWKTVKENIKVNDVVLIHDANLPAGKWSMGRVTKLHPGNDGYVRVVTLKTKNGLIKRPIVKLSALPIRKDEKKDTENDQTSNPREQRKNKRNLISTMILAFIYFMTMITTCCGQKITSLNEDQGIFFDRVANLKLIQDEWKIIVYYDMNPYWNATLSYRKYADYLEHTCTKIKERTHCDVIMLQLQHSFNEIEYYNRILQGQHGYSRQRRGLINGVGYIAHSLFGVLDEEFAEQYAKDITITRSNEKHLVALWKNQTSVMEAEYNLLKRTEVAVQKQNQIFNQHIMRLEQSVTTIQKEINSIGYANEFILSAMAANNLLSSLKNIQDTLLESITNIYKGKFNIHLITPQQLQNELNTISAQLNEDKSLPVNNIQSGLQNIYHLLKISTKMTEDYLIFEVKIPLISRDNYELYQIVAIPKQVGKNMATLIPIAEHIGINLHRDSYIPMSEAEIEQCLLHDETTYMCQVHRPIYKMKSDLDLCIKNNINQCQIEMNTCNNKWIALNNINTYFYFCCDSCQLKTICSDQVTATQLTRANIINLSMNCMIKTENFTVTSHKGLTSKLQQKKYFRTADIPQINHIMKIPVQPTVINITEITSNTTDKLLEDLGKQIEIIKNNSASIEDISYHDIHHYSAIYGIILLACALGAYSTCRRLCRRPEAGPPAAAAARAGAQPPLLPQPLVRGNVSTRNHGTTPVLRRAIFGEEAV